jgi:hypothetical protein
MQDLGNEARQDPSPSQKVLKEFPKDKVSEGTLPLILGSLFVVLAGVLTGWFMSGPSATTTEAEVSQKQEDAVKISANEAGVEDTSDFPDEVEGKLNEGGINGVGTYHLERPGGPSQNVYLTSTVIDLSSFVGKNVKVWGQTLSATKAGWLMDVGKIKVVE